MKPRKIEFEKVEGEKNTFIVKDIKDNVVSSYKIKPRGTGEAPLDIWVGWWCSCPSGNKGKICPHIKKLVQLVSTKEILLDS